METWIELADRTRIWVRDQGAGEVVLLVHGFPLDGSMWDAQRAALSRQYRILAVDLRGFGRSSLDQDTITMDRFADDLAEVLDKLGLSEPVVYGGLSMGGYIGWAFWERHRERVRAMMLLNTRSGADTREIARGREMTANRVLEEGTRGFAAGMLERLFCPATLADKTEVVEHWKEVVDRQSPRAIAAALRGMAQRPNSNRLLPAIQVPVLLIGGQYDRITPPEEMQQMAARLPQAALEVVPDAGHLSPIEQPERVSRAMEDFLARLPR